MNIFTGLIGGKKKDIQALVQGKIISAARSSLNCFVLEFNDGNGIAISVTSNGEPQAQAKIQIEHKLIAELPQISEAVCKVDWQWIYNSTIKSVKPSSTGVNFELNPAGPLLVATGLWQDSPYLYFQPYKPR
jgi:hypothetical protein